MKKNITKKRLQEVLENSLREEIRKEKEFERYMIEEVYDYYTEEETTQEDA